MIGKVYGIPPQPPVEEQTHRVAWHLRLRVSGTDGDRGVEHIAHKRGRYRGRTSTPRIFATVWMISMNEYGRRSVIQ